MFCLIYGMGFLFPLCLYINITEKEKFTKEVTEGAFYGREKIPKMV